MTASAVELEAAGVAFVEAIVVRCAAPTSALPGDRAIVLGDGTIEGFVGGSCADTTVRLQALRALETGEPMLLRILPGEADGPSDEPGAVVVANPCLSGGALELFLEPHLPLPRVAVAGASPVARALVELSAPLGFRARLDAEAEPGDFAAVVASLGHGDEEAVRRGLEAGCEYVGLVASYVRGAAVLEALRAGGVAEPDLARVHTPAGIEIGARTHAEIALAILAELVAVRRAQAAIPAAPGLAERPREAVDPVCGMAVVVGPDTPTAGEHAFCSDGCREAWLSRAG
ncbi:MAG TPA: XdhC family protein [Solirubrobacteraceae bacterium]|nr:XdhC family protein [Solirubrobacteraceae bacterium]